MACLNLYSIYGFVQFGENLEKSKYEYVGANLSIIRLKGLLFDLRLCLIEVDVCFSFLLFVSMRETHLRTP